MELFTDQVKYIEKDKELFSIIGKVSGELFEKGGVIQIVVGTTKISVNVAAGQSVWEIELPEPLTDGNYSLSVVQIDIAGNPSVPTLATIVVDTQKPLSPILINLYDDVGEITGSFDAGKTTDDTRPQLTGVAGKFATVFLKNGDEVIGSAQADENGVWEITPEQDLDIGENTLTLVAQDTFAGKARESDISSPIIIIVEDDGLPAGTAFIDEALDNAGDWMGALASGALTDDATPTLQGRVSPGSTLIIRFRLDDGAWGSETVTATGKTWSWTPSDELATGTWEFEVNAGNGWSDSFALEIINTGAGDNESLNATLSHALDDVGPYTGILKSGAVTDDATPTLIGRAEANSIVIISFGKDGKFDQTASVTTGADGNWQWTPPQELDYQNWSFRAQTSGNISWSDTLNLEIVDSAQHHPAISQVWDDVILEIGKVADNGLTNDNQPTLSGLAQANSVLSIFANGNLLGTVAVDESGRWEFTTPVLADDTQKLSLSYGAYDALAPVFTIIVDTVEPDMPGINAISMNLTYEDIIALGQKEMFINDEKSQYKIDGKEGDVLTLENLATESWASQGQVTLAGVQYEVWSHEAGDAELLVQQGIQTSLNG